MKSASRPRLDAVVLPIRRFFNLEAASGLVLLGAALLAVIWANSPLGWLYQRVFNQPFAVPLHGHHFQVEARVLVSDGPMTLFFFLVGMEIKREMVEGELRSPRRALLPAVAALGGMIVPAVVFRAVCNGTPGVHGWAIPIATDIAFCLGAVKLLGNRVPRSLVVFLTALAIFDDVGGILVIALFHGRGLRAVPLLVAALVAAALVIAGRRRLQKGSVYALGGTALWIALSAAGVHPTIAGVVTGLAVPGRRPAAEGGPEEAPLDRFIRLWHPWVAFGIMPLFALVSSGVQLGGAAGQFGRVTLGAAAGLFLGKQVGVFTATFAAVRLGLAPMPAGSSWISLYGVSLMAGIGFTVALFMAEISFPDAVGLLGQARIGIFIGSLASTLCGLLVIRAAARAGRPSRCLDRAE